eukprot:COSAG05_NODE_715_length_7805_cov_5.098235_11_plen_191_part_01
MRYASLLPLDIPSFFLSRFISFFLSVSLHRWCSSHTWESQAERAARLAEHQARQAAHAEQQRAREQARLARRAVREEEAELNAQARAREELQAAMAEQRRERQAAAAAQAEAAEAAAVHARWARVQAERRELSDARSRLAAEAVREHVAAQRQMERQKRVSVVVRQRRAATARAMQDGGGVEIPPEFICPL